MTISAARPFSFASLLVLGLAACGSPEPAPAAAPAPPAEQAALPAPMGALSRQGIEQAVYAPPAAAAVPPSAEGATPPPALTADQALIRAQILLDRARYSPGVIDGLGGDNTRQAITAFEKASGLTQDGVLDAEVFTRLTASDARPVLVDYVITTQDLAGPFIGAVPTDLEGMSKLETVGYADIREALAERFHMTEGMLTALNPGVDFNRAGQSIVVPAVAADALPGDVARITVDKAERSVRAFDAAGKLLAFYPATIGSSERPAPSGTVTVKGVAPEPNYTYDPSRVTYDRGSKRIVVPAGPNNPVGSVWIDLSRDTYGIHGTPDPSKVGKTFSSGCVRLTNWDAEQLAAHVKPGVEVVFL